MFVYIHPYYTVQKIITYGNVQVGMFRYYQIMQTEKLSGIMLLTL